jgi:hypothetical protein
MKKTTVEMSDVLFEETRRLANEQGIAVKALIEEGLRKVVCDRDRKGSFRLRRATFKGKGLQPQIKGASWESIREVIYEGQGG